MIVSVEEALDVVLNEDIDARDKALAAVARRCVEARTAADRMDALLERCLDESTSDTHEYSPQHLAHVVRFADEHGTVFWEERVKEDR